MKSKIHELQKRKLKVMSKQIITICVVFILTASAFAQAPNKMSYQAVIRNSSNALVTNQTVSMRISILQGTASGTAVYVETQTPTTNINGLASLEIGAGTVSTGNFAAINWANGPYFIKTETDPVGSTNYSIIGTSQLLSVPYALYAKKAEIDNVQDGDTTYWKVNGNNIYYNQGNVGIGVNNSLISKLTISSNTGAVLRAGINTIPDIFQVTSNGNTFFKNTNGQKIMDITNAGKVGINEASPNSYLTVRGGVGSTIDSSHVLLYNKYYASGSPQLKFYSTNNSSTGCYGIQGLKAGVGSGNIVINESGGYLGIGINSPARTLHVNAVMRLEPIATAPTSPAKGDMYFDSTLNKLRVYDGTTWQNCW